MKAACFHASKHLKNEELENILQSCPYFGKNRSKNEFILQKEPEIVLRTCNHCGLSYASKMPRTEVLKEYYSNYYQSKIKVTTDHPQKIANHILNMMSWGTNTINSILDIGGGDGSIAIEIANRIDTHEGLSITIIDPNCGPIIDSDLPYKIESVDNIRDLHESNSYDFIIASAILEHIPELSNTLNHIFSMLSPNGFLYIRTPYMVPIITFFSRFHIYIDFTYPGHLYDMGPVFWSTVINDKKTRYSLSIISSKPSYVETSLFKHPFRTMMAAILKSPWYFISSHYPYVGGWEILIQKKLLI